MQITNRKANYEFFLEPDRFEAGLTLTGAEAQAVRFNHADLSDASIRLMSNELYLINAKIFEQNARDYDPTRSRKLLLHRSEILAIITKMKAKKLTLVPTKMYTRGHLVKLELALGKSKRKYEKRESLKKKDQEKALKDMY